MKFHNNTYMGQVEELMNDINESEKFVKILNQHDFIGNEIYV